MDHTAVWTGTEMLVWGEDPIGGRYDPATDTWSAMSTASQPSDRIYHSAVWTNGLASPVMAVWGGGISGGVSNTGGRYSPP
jgi:hypothetical protein